MRIKSKVELMSTLNNKISKNVDVGIVTIMNEFELPAVKRAFNIEINSKPEQVGDERYWLTQLKSNDSTLDVAITVAGKQGNERAKALTENLIKNFNPETVLLIGIGAGVKGKVSLGDVVISKTIRYYEPAKVLPNKTQSRYNDENSTSFIRKDVKIFTEHSLKIDRWEEAFHKAEGKLKSEGFPDPPGYIHPKPHCGCILSGEKILADGSLEKSQEKDHVSIRAADKEGRGFCRAAKESNLPWLVIRGISDFGDPKTHEKTEMKDKYHHSAANSAATFVRTYLELGYSPQIKKTNIGVIDPSNASDERNESLSEKSDINPWILFDKPIELSSLSKEDFWTKIAEDDTKTLKIRIILPSAKFKDAVPQLPLISDSMFFPDIIANIADIIKETEIKLDVQSLFDIDVVRQIKGEFELQDDILFDCNLILTATGDINLATRLLLQHDSLSNLRPGPAHPKSAILCGIAEKYHAQNNLDVGYLSVLRSPFNDKRVVIFTCGTCAIGTLGAQKLLDLYVTGKANKIGNNRIDRRIPAKIVNFPLKQYPFPLSDRNKFNPPMELQNINVQDLIDGVGVKE